MASASFCIGVMPPSVMFGRSWLRLNEPHPVFLLRSGFPAMEIGHLAIYDAEIHERAGHDDMSALTDLVARKPLS